MGNNSNSTAIVNLALQIIPRSKDKEIYPLVDEAIKIIQQSGLKYKVCPFETVIEGTYEQVMQVAREAQEKCLTAGADDLLVFMKIQRSRLHDVSIEDKMEKYS